MRGVSHRLRTALLAGALAVTGMAGAEGPASSHELIYVDSAGVLRWGKYDTEVAMLGANYCLPSASDYRAAGLVHADRKKLIDQDMAHFDRMGWDALRLSFWGDWECCDRDGNLIANDHLDLLDYLVFRAKQRDLHMLLSPIVTYDSSWPGPPDPQAVGFSRYYRKSELGTNPRAIAAQVNYLRQLLNHVNPYTGLALKDEPYICFIEPVNEPDHHPQDFAGSVRYINALVDAIRSTGCAKLTLFNLSQHFAMAGAINASKADGLGFAWYPSGLVAGHQLQGNFLRALDAYPPMAVPAVAAKPKFVYEYDLPDVISGYHYPAMVRTFRSVGAQFAAMFSYDMLATAPYNLGWQTHCLNLVYTPQKAASAVIASQVMRRLPRLQNYGGYPENTRFGDFRVSYEENLSELVARDLFYYSNNTRSVPPAPAELRRIAGFGSSSTVAYEGVGMYFLDKLDDGEWHLEVYPDSIQIDDPFAPVNTSRPVFQLLVRPWPMTIRLPDLGGGFSVRPLNAGNTYATQATQGTFAIRPGSYLLSAAGRPRTFAVPDRLPGLPYILDPREFVCPPPSDLPPCIVLRAPEEFLAGSPAEIGATVASAEEPSAVSVTVSQAGQSLGSFPMRRTHGYEYAAAVPTAGLAPGAFTYLIAATISGRALSFPHDSPVTASRAEHYTGVLVAPKADLTLFDPSRDLALLDFSRIAEGRFDRPVAVDGSSPGAAALLFRYPAPILPEDYTASLFVGDRLAARAAAPNPQAVHLRLRGAAQASVIHLTLEAADGSAWSAKVFAGSEWSDVALPLSDLRPSQAVLLPQGFPGTWSYWVGGPAPAHPLDLARVERVQLSLRSADFEPAVVADPSRAAVAVERVWLSY